MARQFEAKDSPFHELAEINQLSRNGELLKELRKVLDSYTNFPHIALSKINEIVKRYEDG